MSTTLAEIYRKAAQVLESGGWVQHRMRQPQADGTVAHCALGALTVAVNEQRNEHFCCAECNPDVVAPLTEFLGIDKFDIPTWNDQPDRTREDVVKAFLVAADREEVR